MMDGMFDIAIVAQSPAAGGWVNLLPLAFVLLIFYFLLWRPQSKRQKAHSQFVDALKKGDSVVTDGGMLGSVVRVKDKTVVVEIAKGTKVELLKQSIRGSQGNILTDDDAAEEDSKDEK